MYLFMRNYQINLQCQPHVIFNRISNASSSAAKIIFQRNISCGHIQGQQFSVTAYVILITYCTRI